MAKRIRVLIVSYHFYPSGAIGAKRMSEFALHLQDNGIDVKVLCASIKDKSLHADLALRIARVDRTEIWAPQPIGDRLLSALARKKNKAQAKPDRVVDYSIASRQAPPKQLSFWRKHYQAIELLIDRNKLWSAFSTVVGILHRLWGRYDIVLSTGPPMSPHIAAMLISKVHRAAWISDYRDPWIGSKHRIELAMPRWRLSFEQAAQKMCANRSHAIICASPGIVDFVTQGISSNAAKCSVITNGYDWRLPAKTGNGKLRMLYAGSLYLNRNPFPFFAAIAELVAKPAVDRDKIQVTFVGNCESFRGLSTRDWIMQENLHDVININSPVSTAELKSMTKESDVLVSFAQGQPYQIPGKTFECIGASRVSLVITEVDSVTAHVIDDSGAGLIVPPNDHSCLNEALQKLYDRFVRDGDPFVPDENRIEKFSREVKNREMLDLVRLHIDTR